MTAAMNQTVKVYIINLTSCNTKAGFCIRLAKALGIEVGSILSGEFWSSVCKRTSVLASGRFPAVVRIIGLDSAYTSVTSECETLLRILRAAEEKSPSFRAEALVGSVKWRI